MVIIAQGCLLSWVKWDSIYLVVRMVQEERRERERFFWVDRKACKKKRIATDLYYYYDEIDYKNECMFDNCIQAIYKNVF